MKQLLVIIITLISSVSFAQEIDKALQKSNDYVYDGNKLADEDFVAAEKEYRKAISEKPSNISGAYNLGNAYYKSGYYSEALLRHLESAKSATNKTDKHQVFHNIGNALMQQKQCKEAVEAFKNALRNDPTDDQTRYNLALAKECAKQQGGGDDDKEDEDKKDGEDKEDENKDKGDYKEDKKDGDDKDDKDGKPKDEKGDNDKESPEKEKKKQRQQPKLSPQQVKNLLEAMNNQEKKVQDKINAKKVKGVKVKTEKDW